MIITSTGNNFGAEQIDFKAVLQDNYIILNGTVPFNRESEAYKGAKVLEIYVPDMPMKRSLETAVYMTYTTRSFDRCGTIVRSWVKDKNTVCLEKYKMNDEYTDFEFSFFCIYLPKGQREDQTVSDTLDISVGNLPGYMRCECACASDHGSWAFICLGFGGMNCIEVDAPFTLDLVNFPTDVDVEVPLLGLMRYASGFGNFLMPVRIRNGQFVCDGYTQKQKSQIGDAVLKAFIVRE